MKEIFKPIPYYKYYEVSNYGRVKSFHHKKETILTPGKSGKYLNIHLFRTRKKKNFGVHQLVAMAFLGHKPNGHEIVVRHLDGNPHNNHLSNLRIGTPMENNHDKLIVGTSKYRGVSWNSLQNKWKASICINGKSKHLGYFYKEIKAHEAYQKELTLIN